MTPAMTAHLVLVIASWHKQVGVVQHLLQEEVLQTVMVQEVARQGQRQAARALVLILQLGLAGKEQPLLALCHKLPQSLRHSNEGNAGQADLCRTEDRATRKHP